MNKLGYMQGDGYAFTYQIGETPIMASSDGFHASGAETRADLITAKRVGNYFVWPNGKDNLDPNTCKTLISGNRLLPSLIEKQIAILYGTGPQLYTEKITEEGKVIRCYIKNDRIQAWLDSWRENGLPDTYGTYLNKCIRSYYYSEGIFSKLHLSRAHGAGLRTGLPVAGLEHVSELRCRMATTKDIQQNHDVEDRDFNMVAVGNWERSSGQSSFKLSPRLDYSRPLAKHCAISYSKNPNHGEEVYATNKFFKGLKHWIVGCNATPEYINSFLENSLSARHHVIIPSAWIERQEEMLKNMCFSNKQLRAMGKNEDSFQSVTVGDQTFEVGDEYTPDLLSRYIQMEINNLANFLSGRGKNQGKIYASRSYYNNDGTPECWKIEEIPQKYKEYIEALISYDKRGDMVLLSSKGIDSSISNISGDGVISKSGADTYYNYIVYLTQQSIPEHVVCADLNYAIRLNFPTEWAQGIRIGFYRPNVQRQEDISPKDRLANQSEL